MLVAVFGLRWLEIRWRVLPRSALKWQGSASDAGRKLGTAKGEMSRLEREIENTASRRSSGVFVFGKLAVRTSEARGKGEVRGGPGEVHRMSLGFRLPEANGSEDGGDESGTRFARS